MKLLFTRGAYARVGGSESLASQFATRLAARGHEVRVVCAQAFDDRRVFSDCGVEVVQVKPRGGFLGLAADATTLVDLMRTDVLEWYAEDRDLVHNIGREYLDSSLAVAEGLGIPIVLTPLAHPGQFHGGDMPSDFDRYRRADVITTMTDWERAWFAAGGVDRARLVTTGMGPNAARSTDGKAFRAAHRIPADAPLVLYIGRKERYKGYIHLLDAAEVVWRTQPETRFVFIGIPGFYSSFFDEFARYADERIVDIERASGAERSAALDACDVFAMPSLHETFGIGYLEAWLHERPVVGGDIPPLREVIAHGADGLLVHQRAGDVAAAILRLLDDPALRAAMGLAARRSSPNGGIGTASWTASRPPTRSRSAPRRARTRRWPSARRVRIVIAKKLLSSIGGSEAQARALATALHERGHDITVVGLRPAWRRPGIPAAVYASPPGPVALREGGVRYVFIPTLGGRVGAAIDGLAPTTLVSRSELGRAVAGAEVVHSSAREWVGPLERAARAAGAAFVETPLVHPGQPFSGASATDLARYRRDDAIVALTEWEAQWYRLRGARSVHVTGVGANLAPLPEVPMDGATVLFVVRKY